MDVMAKYSIPSFRSSSVTSLLVLYVLTGAMTVSQHDSIAATRPPLLRAFGGADIATALMPSREQR
jgi:hypothetical protein